MRHSWLVVPIFVYVICLIYIANIEDQPKAVETILKKHVVENMQLNAEDIKWLKRRSILGKSINPLWNWLLSPEGSSPPAKITNRSNPFLIVVWRHGLILDKRFSWRFSQKKKYSPWESCSVQNCELSFKPTHLHKADAVMFYVFQTVSVRLIPPRRNPDQWWIYFCDESPPNAFWVRNQSLEDYNGLFNWSMTYRSDSDVPVPYGRTILRDKMDTKFNVQKIVAEKTRLVAVLGSNCAPDNKRWDYVAKLKNELGEDLKILGKCRNGDRRICPGHFEDDCPALSTFKFYLAFENSNCHEYITEKVFWNSYNKQSVPVIMGAPKSDCELFLPPNSYIHVDDFASPTSLASYLRYLDNDNAEYSKYHAWRRKYRVINEHGYFGSPARYYCRVCEALNYNAPSRKTIRRLADFWNTREDCRE